MIACRRIATRSHWQVRMLLGCSTPHPKVRRAAMRSARANQTSQGQPTDLRGHAVCRLPPERLISRPVDLQLLQLLHNDHHGWTLRGWLDPMYVLGLLNLPASAQAPHLCRALLEAVMVCAEGAADGEAGSCMRVPRFGVGSTFSHCGLRSCV